MVIHTTVIGGTYLPAVTFCRSASGPGTYAERHVPPISRVLDQGVGAFLCCASFEKRSLSIASSIKELRFQRVFVFASEDCRSEINDSALVIQSFFEDRASIVTTRMREPLFTANAIAKAVQQIINDGIKDIIIDAQLLRMRCFLFY